MNSDNETRILLAEDDPNFGPFLQTYLEAKGFPCFLATNGKMGLEAFLSGSYDFCISDVMMPIMDGFAMAQEIRKKNSKIPILFLTAKTLEEDRLRGFQIGGDDYLTKPFSIEELTLRIHAIVRRGKAPIEDNRMLFSIGKLNFDYDRQVISGPQGENRLTAKEAELLRLLCQYENEVLFRKLALLKIWHEDSIYNARSMDVYITKIRKVLKDDPNIELINIHGVGFKLATVAKYNEKKIC